MLDRELLSRVRESLGMPKAASVAAQPSPLMSKHAGIRDILKLLGAGAALGAGGYGGYKAIRPLVENMSQPLPSEEPEFDPSEQRMFARYGMDPERMKFLQTLANWRSGMDLERGMLADALKGKLPAPSAGASNDLASYA